VAFKNYKPEIWAAAFLVQLRKQLVYAGPQIVNHDYEGDIQAAGDTVHITGIGDVTVFDYDEDTDLDYEDVPDAGTTLVIDQQKAFAVGVKDIDKAQALNGGRAVAQIMSQGAYRMSDAADQFVAGKHAEIPAGNTLTAVTDFTTDKGTAYNTLVDLGVLLDENDVPTEGRYAVIPPWYHGILRKDPNFINAEKSGSTAPLLNGQVGEAAGFAILKSNNNPSLSGGTQNVVQAGTPMAISFANQLVENEALRDQKRFRDLLRALHVYGGKVTYPNGLAKVICTRPGS
jgi:N4-gp56 family major capsid protein